MSAASEHGRPRGASRVGHSLYSQLAAFVGEHPGCTLDDMAVSFAADGDVWILRTVCGES